MHETIYLSDPSSALRIQYSCAALEEIRERAVGGLLTVPRVPVGVGGLLVGVREKGLIRILDSIEVPCSHSAGPGFSLTPAEKNECQAMMTEAGEADGTGRVTVVGWYCSKTRGDGSPSEEDLRFYREFFPEIWQVGMVVRPTALDDMPARFYRRDAAGQVVKAIDCVVEAWRPKSQDSAEPAEVTPIEMAVPPEPVTPVAPMPVAAQEEPPAIPSAVKLDKTRLADLVGALSDEKPSEQKPRPVTTPRPNPGATFFDQAVVNPARRASGPNQLLIGIGVAVVVLVLGVVAFLTRDSWLPRPELTMSSSEVDGSLLIRWNAGALRGIDHASLYVNDGGVLQTLPMDRFEINSGTFGYKPKTQRVSVKLSAGKISGITTWFAAPPPAAPQVTVPPISSSADSSGSTVPATTVLPSSEGTVQRRPGAAVGSTIPVTAAPR